MASSSRPDKRRPNELRPLRIETGYLKFPAGSVLISAGDTRLICAASIEESVPDFLRGKGIGWLTAEYGMLPGSTPGRKRREAPGGKPDGRTMEIRRIIGRVLRQAVDLKRLGERTLWLDCDVIQADGGTRTLGVTGAWVALRLACDSLLKRGVLTCDPVIRQVAAVSVGVVNGRCLLDLNYVEDSAAEVDMNVSMAGDGRLIEVQATAEHEPFPEMQMRRMLNLAASGCRKLMKAQKEACRSAGRAR